MSDRDMQTAPVRGWAVVWACAATAALVASLGIIGSDALWLVPLGGRIAHGHLPDSIPYATAPTSGWHDVPAGGQLVFWAAYEAFGGERGLVVLQAAGSALGLGALAWGLSRRGSGGASLVAAALVLIGSLPTVAVANAALFSLACFPVLLALVEADDRSPSRRLWLAVPLLAVWGNLHGAVLAGWALLMCYLVLGKARRRSPEAVLLAVGATLALFANPTLWQSPSYYAAVLGSEVARQGLGLWVPLSLTPLNALMVAAFAALALAAMRRRAARLWEGVALVGLVLATVHVSRNGVWLLFVAAYPATRAFQVAVKRHDLLALTAGAATVAAGASLVRTPLDPGSRDLADLAASMRQTVLAEPVLGQQVAVAGGRVWVENPIDAFRRADQRLYIAWSIGRPSGDAAVAHARLVLVSPASAAGLRAASDRRLVLLTAGHGAALYRVRRSGRA